jgi:hypothetical protein
MLGAAEAREVTASREVKQARMVLGWVEVVSVFMGKLSLVNLLIRRVVLTRPIGR